MKTLFRMLPALLTALNLVILAGCKEEEETPRPTLPRVGQVNVTLGEDTLCISRFGVDDTTSVIVTVLNTRNEPMRGVRVNVTLSGLNWDSLEYTNPVLRDTTDQNGQVALIYTACSYGSDWIRATVDGISDSALIVSASSQDSWPPYFSLVVAPDTIHLTPPDSAQVQIRFLGLPGPVVGFVATMSISGGIMDPMPPTDSAGFAQAYWHPTDTGRFWLTTEYPWPNDLCHRGLLHADTLWVTVLP